MDNIINQITQERFNMRFTGNERELLEDICKYDNLPNLSEAIRAAVQEYHTRHILNGRLKEIRSEIGYTSLEGNSHPITADN